MKKMKTFRFAGLVFLVSILGISCSESGSNRYKTIKIGDQEWMAENLNNSRHRNGDKIPEAKTGEEWVAYGGEGTGAYCNFGNNVNNAATYGRLYNWYAVNDPRGLAPQGWHTPTDAEWVTLTATLGGEEVAGAKMKSTSGWAEDDNGTNESGFSALPGGYRHYLNGNYDAMGYFAFFWSSTENPHYTDIHYRHPAWTRSLNDGNSEASRSGNDKQYGFSVRCVRDL